MLLSVKTLVPDMDITMYVCTYIVGEEKPTFVSSLRRIPPGPPGHVG